MPAHLLSGDWAMAQTAVRAVSCDTCGKQYRYKPELAGKKVKCPCGGRVRFPLDEQKPPVPVEIDLEHVAQAEAVAVQEEEIAEAPPIAPPLPSSKPARPTAGAALAKSVIARATKTSTTHSSDEKW